MAPGPTKVADLVIPEVLEDTMKGTWAGRYALWDSQAVAVSPSLPMEKKGGEKVKVPRFNTIGEFIDIAVEGDAAPVEKIDQTTEQALIKHAAKVISLSKLTEICRSKQPGASNYDEVARQMSTGAFRRFDSHLIEVASAVDVDMTLDVHSSVTPRTFDYDLMIDGKQLWGDEQEEIVQVVMHSKVYGDLLKLKLTNGMPLLTLPTDGSVARFAGVPIKLSDRLAPVSGKYTTLLLKRWALALWFNGNPRSEAGRDIRADVDYLATHIYWVAHRYERDPNGTKSGVVILKHN